MLVFLSKSGWSFFVMFSPQKKEEKVWNNRIKKEKKKRQIKYDTKDGSQTVYTNLCVGRTCAYFSLILFCR